MGKTGARKRVANKLGEKPFNVEDRVQHQIRKKDKELLNMYLWHEEQMADVRAEYERKLLKNGQGAIDLTDDPRGDLSASELKIVLDGKDEELRDFRDREVILKKKVEEGEENTKILGQAKELIQIMLSHHYCFSKKNVWIVNQAQNMGVVDADSYNNFADKMTDESVENVLINPILDLMKATKSST